jgi:hypothetical protein
MRAFFAEPNSIKDAGEIQEKTPPHSRDEAEVQ